MGNRIRSPGVLAAAFALIAALSGVVVFAENIDPNNDDSQRAWGENVGWLNAEPANCSGCGIQVGTTGLTGYMWGENIGWISLSCQNREPTVSCASVGNYGVSKAPGGQLSGYAWAENAGWISFSCQNNPPSCAGTGNYGVSINPPTGNFSGYAWGENIGWISFSDTSPVAYRVQTLPDTDSDGILNDIDQDDDGDGVFDTAEATGACGADPLNPAVRPERLDGAFAGVSDDGDGAVDEALPAGSEGFDCDGDGWFGNQENLIYGDVPSTARDQDPCGSNGWAADLAGNNNTLNIADINSFLSPPRAAADYGSGGSFNTFGHNLDDDGDTVIESAEDPGAPGGPTFNLARWNLLNPPHGTTTPINIGDLNSLITGAAGSPARPPMLGGNQAFYTNGGVCPFPP